ncbi:MAG: deaminase [Deltaproteobacteria bacterium]|nr:deaminase [Deltaproteobacteria bacterium]
MEIIIAPKAPAAIGPYSHAIKSGHTIYISGQVPFDPVTGNLVGATMTEQATQAMKNLASVLEAAGLTMSNLVKTTVYLVNWNDFASFNAVYSQFLGNHKPARACMEVSKIAKDALLEIEAIAEVS